MSDAENQEAPIQLPPRRGAAIEAVLDEGAVRYEMTDYARARELLGAVLLEVPALKPQLFYYLRVCDRVLATPVLASEIRLEARLSRWFRWPTVVRWLLPIHDQRRCKWCGRYTSYRDPYEGSHPHFGSNFCASCHREFPMPSWHWDSPEGRKYSFNRHSFESKEFYLEFSEDYPNH